MMQWSMENGNIEWGTRYAVLNDLAPIAAFITKNYTTPININVFANEAESILRACDDECGWMWVDHASGTNEKA